MGNFFNKKISALYDILSNKKRRKIIWHCQVTFEKNWQLKLKNRGLQGLLSVMKSTVLYCKVLCQDFWGPCQEWIPCNGKELTPFYVRFLPNPEYYKRWNFIFMITDFKRKRYSLSHYWSSSLIWRFQNCEQGLEFRGSWILEGHFGLPESIRKFSPQKSGKFRNPI